MRIYHVANTVSRKVQAHDRQNNQYPGENRHPPSFEDDQLAIVQDVPPARVRRRDSGPQKA